MRDAQPMHRGATDPGAAVPAAHAAATLAAIAVDRSSSRRVLARWLAAPGGAGAPPPAGADPVTGYLAVAVPAPAVPAPAVPAAPVPAAGPADGEAADHPHGHGHVLHLPSPIGFARHALPSLVESTIGPAVLFYVVLSLVGFRGALLAALGWSYAAAARRLVRRQRMPGMLLLGVVLLTLRTAVAFATGSAFVYFVQPSIGTVGVAVLFAVTAALRRPIIERLAHDFCPLDPDLMARPHVRTFFLRISLLWALVLLTNAGMALFLLLESSLKAFVIERTALSVGLIGVGVLVSVVWFVRTMSRVGVSVRWSGAPAA